MPSIPIKLRSKVIHIHNALVAPDFGKPTVLVRNQWEYVSMWLKRHSSTRSLFFWDQARHFYHASQQLPKTSSPLPMYYSALNATKALLISKDIHHSDRHGLTGSHQSGNVNLQNEVVKLKGGGVLPALCKYLGESPCTEKYTLKDILYNLPCIHRAYTLTFTTPPELFIPIAAPIFVRKRRSNEAYFQCKIRDSRYQNERTMSIISGFERDHSVEDAYVVRRKKCFLWKRGDPKQENLRRLRSYHHGIRKRVGYIKGLSRLWYLKRNDAPGGFIDMSCITLVFAALHRLSELARYTPDRLAKHFECRHNWLLSEFLDWALDQFIDQISSEITGKDFMSPGYVG